MKKTSSKYATNLSQRYQKSKRYLKTQKVHCMEKALINRNPVGTGAHYSSDGGRIVIVLVLYPNRLYVL